jgi:hypothetical protein
VHQVLRNFLITVVAAIVMSLSVSAVGFAAANPSGQGQPNQSCEEQPATPAGFLSDGFLNVADSHYAGPGSVGHAGSSHAVSQYDVACFQVSQR